MIVPWKKQNLLSKNMVPNISCDSKKWEFETRKDLRSFGFRFTEREKREGREEMSKAMGQRE